MTAVEYVLPIFILLAIILAAVKKVNVYEGFAAGIKEVIPLLVTIFPYMAAVFVMTELMEQSGLTDLITTAVAPLFKFLGIPPELSRLILLKPFSGSGSIALLSQIYSSYGADSYVSRCAGSIFGSSETIFYVSAVYFSACKDKRVKKAVAISLTATLVSCVFACLICRFI